MPDQHSYEELIQRIAKLEKQNSKLQSEAIKYRMLFDSFPHGITVSDAHGNVIEANSISERLLGVNKADHTNREISGKEWRIIGKDGNDMPVNEWPSVIALKEDRLVTDCEIGIAKPNNQITWLNVTAAPIPLEGYGVVITYNDITKRNLAEKAIQEKEKEIIAKQKKLEKSEALFRGLFDNMTSGSAIYEVINGGLKGADYIIKGFNTTSLKIEGKTIAQVIGKSLYDLRPNIDDFGLIPKLRKVWETGEPDYFPMTIYQDEKFSNYYENFIFKIPSGEVVTIYNDVTDQKNSELALKNSEKKYRDLFENMAQGVFYQSNDGKLFNINSAALKMFGLTYDQFVEKTSKDPQWQVIHEDGTDFPGEEHPSMVSLRTGKECRDVVAGIYNVKKGRYIWSSINAIPQFKEGEEQPYQVFVTMHDITALKQSEDLLRIQHDLAIKLSHHTGKFDEGLNISLNSALNASNMDAGGIYLFDEKTKDLNLELHKGFSNHFVNSVSRYEKDSPNVCLIMKGQPKYINHQDSVLNLTTAEKIENLKAVAIIPIKFQNQIFGCMNVASKSIETIPESTRMILETITNQIGQSFVHLKTQTNLRKSEERYQDLYNNAPDMYVSVCAKSATVLDCNHTINNALGYSKEEIIGHSVFNLYMPDSAERAKTIVFPQFLKTGSVSVEEMQLKRKNGSSLYVSLNATAIRDEKGNIIESRSVWRDITRQMKLKQRLLQAQKMESIGDLAGGIAHDFNNILSPIIGMSELLLEDLPPNGLEYESAEEIYKAGKRASELVKQILAFSRQSEKKLVPTRIQKVLQEVIKLCRSSIPVDIEIKQDIHPECGLVLADSTQIHQIAMNIITNAYHAIGSKSGEISVKLSESTLTSFPMRTNLSPGKYVVFSVADNGHGIPPDIMSKIFDPYFTTKEKGKGTGLGLSVVYGITKEHKGDIYVNSEVGKGTSFKLYFPLIRQVDQVQIKKEVKPSPTGNEHILLVDDEPPIAKLEARILERLGYKTTLRLNSIEALEAFRTNPGSFDLVISDVTMPKMTGDELTKELISIRPDIPIILCTGFSERINEDKAATLGIKNLLMKPIVSSKMAEVVRQVLDETKKT